MGDTVRSCQEKGDASTALSLTHRSARLIGMRGLWLPIITGFLFGCAGRSIDVPQPVRLSLTPASSMVVTVSDTSYREVVLGLQLKKQLRKAYSYRLAADKELEEYLRRTGQSIQDLWKDPKLAQGLNVDTVITPRVIEWKKDESAPQRRVYFDKPGVIQYCTRITGTLRISFTLWRSRDGVKLFEDEISSSRQTKECSPDLTKAGDAPTTSTKTEEKALSKTPGVSVPDPFLTGALDASWESDPFFESVVKKAVASFIDIIDPNPLREMFIFANDMTGYESGRQLVKARNYLRESEWAAALTVLEKNLVKHPDSYATQYLIGVAQQGQKDFGSAKNSYQQALALCQAKREASTPENAPDCDYIEEAYKISQSWDLDGTLKDIPKAE